MSGMISLKDKAMDKYILDEVAIISKLAIIEKHLEGFNKCFYEPTSDFNSNDSLSVQKEASRMLKFVGLKNYFPIITYEKHNDSVGGQVELDNSENVFIEINEKFRGDSEKVLAVIAHEICHKVLYVHNLYYPYLKIENEILTDLATVYVGFGKLSLNGCYSQEVSTKMEWRNGNAVEVKTTHSQTVGYLSLNQFALAFNVVCNVYGITYEEKIKGLNQTSRAKVSSVTIKLLNPITIKEIRNSLKSIQDGDAKLYNSIIVMECILSDLRNKLKERHNQYRNDLLRPYGEGDPSQKVDKQIIAFSLLNKYKSTNEDVILQQHLQNVIDYYKGHESLDCSALLDIECPICSYKKKSALKDYKRLFVKCPNCGYLFVWDAELKKETVVEDEDEEFVEVLETRKNSDEENNYKRGKKFLKPNQKKTNNIIKGLKYVFIMCFMLTFIPFCIYTPIHWVFKVLMIAPYSFVYYFIAKWFLPFGFDAKCEIKRQYDGDEVLGLDHGIGYVLRGSYGVSGDKHRSYLFLSVFYIMVPVKSLVVEEGTTYKVFKQHNGSKDHVCGVGEWYILEVIWLYLIQVMSIGAIVLMWYIIAYFLL